MRYTIIGSGAMGLRYGILLQEEGGFQVDFVDTWKPQVETIKNQHGVFVSRDGQNKHLVPINIYYPEEYDKNSDVLIFFVKQYQLSKFLVRCSSFFNKKQYVVTCMNGMGHIKKLNRYFSKEKLLGGTAMLGTVLNGPGDVDFIGPKGTGYTNLAKQTEKTDKKSKQITKDFSKSNLHATLTNNFLGTLMSKVIFNSVVNTLCTMFRMRMGEFIKFPLAKKLSLQLINEAFDVCERAGINLLTNRKEEWEAVLQVSGVNNPLHFPSMYQDISKKRKTEVDYINGYIYDLGLRYHYEAKTHDFLRNLVHLSEFSSTFNVNEYVQSVLQKEKSFKLA